MPGLEPGIHVFAAARRKTWMAATSAAMTDESARFNATSMAMTNERARSDERGHDDESARDDCRET